MVRSRWPVRAPASTKAPERLLTGPVSPVPQHPGRGRAGRGTRPMAGCRDPVTSAPRTTPGGSGLLLVQRRDAGPPVVRVPPVEPEARTMLQRRRSAAHSRVSGQSSCSSGGAAGSRARAAASSARSPSTARTARSLSMACTARTATSSSLASNSDAQADFRSKRTARTTCHGNSCRVAMFRIRMPARSASTRARPRSRMPAPSTSPRPMIATWSPVPNLTTPVDDDLSRRPATSIEPVTNAAASTQSSRMRRGTAETGSDVGEAGRVTPPWWQPPRTAGARLAECGGVEISGTAQHAAWQARTVPPVEQLRSDLWSIPVPMGGPLRYVSVYAIALDGGGLGLLDTGWESDAGWAALTGGLAQIGGGLEDVRGVLVTHLHFDHLGLARRVREASGAWLAMHPADARVVSRLSSRDAEAAVAEEVEFLVGLGADRAEAVRDVGPAEHMRAFTLMAVPDRLLEDGDHAAFPGWRMRAVHTPGHTPGHLCFAEERTGLFFSGDHVLPRISPNISTGSFSGADPLRNFLSSLAAVRDLNPVEVLPAHEWRFRGLDSRVDELTTHHEHRLAELLAAIARHPHSTPWQLAAFLTWSRPWEGYERRLRIFAVTEADAHLRTLAGRGLVVGSGGAVLTWGRAARCAARRSPPWP